MAGRVSQIVVETVNGFSANARSSQLVLETLIDASGHVRVSQATLEVCIGLASNARASQIVLEVLRTNPALVSQIVAEVLIQTPVPPPIIIFPQLIGEEFPVVRRPIFRTAQAVAAGSGRSTRAQFATWPTWEWDISWSYLADAGSISDLKTLQAFFLSMSGKWQYFAYQDTTHNAVSDMTQMVGDGAINSFVLGYDAGLAPFDFVEPIGLLDLRSPLNVYFNGVLQSVSTYTTNLYQPHAQTVTLSATPALGVVVSVDMSFLFCARFKEDSQDFEQFMQHIWLNKKITLQSVPG